MDIPPHSSLPLVIRSMKKIFVLTAFIFLPFRVNASTIEWNNTGSDYATNSDWVLGVAPANSTTTDIAAFGATGASAINPVLAAARSVAGVSFLSGAYAYTFSGAILTIGASGISDSAANTESFSNTLRPSTSETWTTAGGGTLVFNGTVDINGNAATTRTLTIAGAGTTTINGALQNSFAGSTGKFIYSGTGTLTLANTNSYNGGTTVSGSGGVLLATATGSLGAGNVSLTAGTVTLTLQGVSQDYIANTANLSIGFTTDVVNLNFTGTDVIGSLTVAGIQELPGIYGGTGSGATFILPEFAGTGTLTVLSTIPEPSTFATVGFGGVLFLAARSMRRKRV